MKNWRLWAGLLLSIAAFVSYFAFFNRFPITRDVPWVNFILFVVATVPLIAGVRRSQRKIWSGIIAFLGIAVFAFFVFAVTVASRRLPPSHGAPVTGDPSATPSYGVLNSNSVVLKRRAYGRWPSAGYTFTFLSDPNTEIIRRYDLLHKGAGENGHDIARPAEFLIDRSGTVRWANLTEDLRIRARPEQMLAQAISPAPHGVLFLQSALDQERIDHRIAAAESSVHRRGFLTAAARQHHVAETLAVGPGHPAVLLEPVVRVVVDQLAPEVRVVAGRVSAAPHM